jgi:hypothetical protein
MPSPGMTAIRNGIGYSISAASRERFRGPDRYHYIVLTEERALQAALGKMRRLRRIRRLSRLTYWAAWGVVGLVCLLLLVGGIAGLASG